MKAKISKVWIEQLTETDADLSYLGEYSSEADPSRPEVIDRHARGDMGRNEYRYWTHTQDFEANRRSLNRDHGMAKHAAWLEARRYIMEDYKRCEDYDKDDWHMTGIRARAEILVPQGRHWIIQRITSGGLWGIESDSDEDYKDQVGADELTDLREMLDALNVDLSAWPADWDTIETRCV